ncbi:cobalamin biosynthesis protein [Gandjariella thermophila]|uniref:Cobalamin biosynthesis protein CobD n=1 Tax=Gandjariella thermophila TaxID=1931992 RepID=A0A4D4JBZ3_9PSEU|nr:cobalamin biosynthesis protein [Gandjariella thermophila]GDY33114.1 cobalamin biosynthesis protein CobD [Gandjariella thermophila]
MGVARAIGLLLGMAADGALGDPRRGHPVAAFGRLAGRVERALYRDDRLAGAAHTALLTGAAVLLGAAGQRFGRRGPALEAATTALATWAVLGGTSLAGEGVAVGRALDAGDLAAARERLPGLCGRDPDSLDTNGLARAAVESVAENTSDAVVAPLLWGAVAGIPGLLGYRAVNTLDAMIGHRSARYRRFGWAAARLDDLANLVPSRVAALITAGCAPVVGGSAAEAWRAFRRDAAAHPSPNAGQVEAAFAGALEVRLGGRTVYPYGVEDRPVLGVGRMPDAGHVTRAVELSRVVGTVAAAIAALLALVFGRRRARR